MAIEWKVLLLECVPPAVAPGIRLRHFGDTRSKVVTGKLTDFLNTSSGGRPMGIAMGYKLDGTALTNNPDYASPSFVGPATAGALVDARFQPFLNALWSYSSAHLATNYYDTELELLSLIVASGNWLNP